ncbi:MAG: GspE/PulE family protein [Candidatus Uhrbacteria bacterium]
MPRRIGGNQSATVIPAVEPQKLPWQKILVEENYLTEKDITNAEAYAKLHHADSLDFLFSEGLITKDLFGQAVAEFYKLSYADLNSHQPVKEQVLKIPEALAKNQRVILFREEKDKVTLTTDRPDQTISEEIKKLFPKKKIVLAYSVTEDIEVALVNYRKTLDTRFAKILAEKGRMASEMIEEIIGDALSFRASDIHFDPQETEVVIRFRIDGVLQEAGRLPKEFYENILNRIKVLSRLRTDEHFSAQDGAIRYKNQGQAVDMRVSVVPILDGEKVVIRLLSEYVRRFTLGDLGFSEAQQKQVVISSEKPFGMILVIGPTGSGKSTTLYALLKMLNSPELNIATIEDPVEYKIVGVNHIQVNTQTNLTFAKGLRSIVRQDPDIILVGEIRDQETAEIAVNAALTGHLLLSTFHANDAATAIPRLLDMGVEPFLLSSTLELLIAQRLARRICENCRYSLVVDQTEMKKNFPSVAKFFPPSLTLYRGKGCQACNNTGYKGRVAIFEFIRATPELQDLILRNPSARNIWELASLQGAKTLFFDGLEKVKTGVTTLEELLRVAAPPEETEIEKAGNDKILNNKKNKTS